MSWTEWSIVSAFVLASLALRGSVAQEGPRGGMAVRSGGRGARQSRVVLTMFLCSVGGMWLLPWAAGLPSAPLWVGGAFALLLALGAAWAASGREEEG